MARSDLHIKIKLEYPDDEDPEKIADEICRQLLKAYGVRKTEISNLVKDSEPSSN